MSRFITFGRTTPREAAFLKALVSWICIALGTIMLLFNRDWRSINGYVFAVLNVLFVIVAIASRWKLTARQEVIFKWLANGVFLGWGAYFVITQTSGNGRWLIAATFALVFFMLCRPQRVPANPPGPDPDSPSESNS